MSIRDEARELFKAFDALPIAEQAKHSFNPEWYLLAVELLNELDKPQNEFKPDWDLLEATQESLREHMEMVKDLQDKLEKADKVIDAANELMSVVPMYRTMSMYGLLDKALQLYKENKG